MGDPMESMQKGLVMVGAGGIPRTWETMFSNALIVINEIAKHGRNDPFWTLGCGTCWRALKIASLGLDGQLGCASTFIDAHRNRYRLTSMCRVA
jgi:hypothetical protein